VTNTRADRDPDPADWLFWAAVWLALVLVGVKAYYLGARGDLTTVELLANLRSLAAISYHDVAFAFVAWAVARAALFLSASRTWAGRGVVSAFILFATLSCLYAIASIIAFGVLGGFLTYALLQMIGNVRMLSSSIVVYLSRRVELGLVTVPLTYIGLVWLSTRMRPLARGPRWIRAAAALTMLIIWALVGHRTYISEWATHYDWRIADNAPWVLASSWWRAMRADRTVRLTERFTPEDMADFEPVGQRLFSYAVFTRLMMFEAFTAAVIAKR